MDVLDIARWQFGIITVYHFLFVPITIGLSRDRRRLRDGLGAHRRPEYLRLTKFFGKLFLINFAIGVVTGIVQEFQFGMNWCDYSRFVGDIFGAPLAIEGLLAFFLESTFLGLWIFGWDELPAQAPRRLYLDRAHRHAAVGVLHPRGELLDAASGRLPLQPRRPGRAELDDFAAVMFNKVQLVTFPHVVLAAYMTGGAFVARRGACAVLKERTPHDRPMYRTALRTGAWVTLVAGLGVAVRATSRARS